MKGLIFLFIILAAGFILYVRWLEEQSIFFPSKDVVFTPEQQGLAYEDIFLKTPDGILLNGWFVRDSNLSEKAPTLLFLHGNAGNIADRIDKIALFQRMGLNVFIIDYRGYGRSEGTPSEKGLYTDALAAFDYVMTRPDVSPAAVVVYGESLGGVAAIDLAAQRNLAALIVDSSFTSAADMARLMYPFVPSFLLNVKMDSVSKVGSLSVPKLFLHTTEDEVVPFFLGKKLFEAAAEPKEFASLSGTHNDGYMMDEKAFVQTIRIFLVKWGILP